MPNKRTKRKLADSEPPSKSSKVTFLSPSLILLEIPADTNTSLPVWEAMRSQQVDIAWTVNPYSISVHLTPVSSTQGKITTSRKSESTSSVAQTIVPSTRILQPQMVIQFITQQHGATQNSCVLLTLSQNGTHLLPSPPGQPLKIPPNPTPATAVIVSLPLIITQQQPPHQPGTSTKRQILPATQSPTATPTKQRAPSKVPVPSLFHTRSSPDIQVCDRFLLGLCSAGKRCKMHHTPYPFHWQLWCVTTHQWIDIPSRSQVLLERNYCNVDQKLIYFKDGTGIQPVSTEPVGDPPGENFSVDPLQEFSSWYPPVWCLASEQDYSLVDLPAGTQAYRSIENLFNESLPETKVDIISIEQIQNLLHWDKYQRQKAYMQKQHTNSKEPLERHLFHGTTKEPSEDICHNNFDPRMAGVHGTSQGFGSYFATTASFSHKYTAREGPDKVRHMFLAKVLVGKTCLGRFNYRRPPLNSKMRQFYLYDSCVDNMDKPTMFVVFDSCQCYPYYLIKYKDLPQEIDI
ncbi:protein mono-ADP-ribosyltransferase TIPARP-like isoform X2 [Perca fluviatilis]|uniref:protein mono-ADP-ribosyltransferase TIPARP-like isoform X2 n=1 Tax=Perca fluviatilis TaxID=8168 RepID=UPI001964AB83|nr:protein mono-ADP-ribosyltransferase TIPARP-like isoform X2 [Perca fluviatilis]